MNILNKVTAKSLKINKTRTIVTIIGIILSSAMIVAVISFIISLQKFLIDSQKLSSGSWHVMSTEITKSELDTIGQSTKINDISFFQNIGYSRLEDCENNYKPYLFISGFEPELFDTLPVNILSGRLPENSNEIVIPEHLSSNGGIGYKIGDVLTLDIGNRYIDGQKIYQDNALVTDENDNVLETFRPAISRTYTIVGIASRPEFERRSAPGYTAITIYDKSIDSDSYNCYMHMKNPKDSIDFAESEIPNGSVNRDLLMYMGVSSNNAFNRIAYSFGGILILLIMLGSIALIYNAFSISVSERTKQFGLLSSIGATKKQLKKTVLFEAMYVSVIGIPIGIIFGIIGAAITLYVVNPMFASLFFSNHAVHADIKLTLSLASIIASIVISLITVLISAYIPALRASKKSAIDAIRQAGDIKLNYKNVKTSKLTYKLFGLEGLIASKNFKRNKKKYRSTIISISMSIILFISAFSFTSYIQSSYNGAADMRDVDIIYQSNEFDDYNEASTLYNLIKDADAVTESSSSMSLTIFGTTASYDALSQDYITNNAENLEDNPDVFLYSIISFIPDDQYNSLLSKLGIFKQQDTAQALVYNNFNFIDREGSYRNANIFKGNFPINLSFGVFNYSNEKDLYSFSDQYNKTDIVVSGQITKEMLPLSIRHISGNNPVFILPASDMQLFDIKSGDLYTVFGFKSSDNQKTYNSLKSLLVQNGYDFSSLIDYKESIQNIINASTVINIFSYGFIILISLIAVANIFNTISTNVRLRRKEFAMLKSVGMTRRGFNKMMNFECLLYGIKSLIIGLPIAILISFWIYVSAMMGVDVRFTLPYQAILICVLCVFIVVFTTMLYSMNKIKKENTIDALKSDIM